MTRLADFFRSTNVRIGLLSILFFWMAIGYFELRHLEILSPILWAAISLLAGVAIVVYAVKPSWQLYQLAGTSGVIAIAARITSVMVNLIHGGVYKSPWTGIVALPIYIIASICFALFWYALAPKLVKDKETSEMV